MPDVRNAEASLIAERPFAGPTIPRVIHQIYLGGSMPEALAANVAALIAQNSGWEHRLYHEDMVQILLLYQRILPNYGVARADLFRYLLLYHTGRIYLDIKSRFLRPIDYVITGNKGFIGSYWSNSPGERYEGLGLHVPTAGAPRSELQQWHVIAAPGHPFLKAVIERVLANIVAYRPWRDGVGKTGVLKLTGPVLYTQAILPLLDRYPCMVVANEAALSLGYSILENLDHVRLFQRDYSYSLRPIVQLSGIRRHIATGVLDRLRPNPAAGATPRDRTEPLMIMSVKLAVGAM